MTDPRLARALQRWLGIIAVAVAIFAFGTIKDYWFPYYYYYADIDMAHAGMALQLNSGLGQTSYDHPAHTWTILLSQWLRFTSWLGMNPAVYSDVQASPEFARWIVPTIAMGRIFNSVLAVAFSALAGFLGSRISGNRAIGWCLAIATALAPATLWQAVMLRDELMAAFFLFLAFGSAVLVAARTGARPECPMFLFGAGGYYALATKLQVAPTLLLGFPVLAFAFATGPATEVASPVKCFHAWTRANNPLMRTAGFAAAALAIGALGIFGAASIFYVFFRGRSFEGYHLVTLAVFALPTLAQKAARRDIGPSLAALSWGALGAASAFASMLPWWEGAVYYRVFHYFEFLLTAMDAKLQTGAGTAAAAFAGYVPRALERAFLVSPGENPFVFLNWIQVFGLSAVFARRGLRAGGSQTWLSVLLTAWAISMDAMHRLRYREHSLYNDVFIDFLRFLALATLWPAVAKELRARSPRIAVGFIGGAFAIATFSMEGGRSLVAVLSTREPHQETSEACDQSVYSPPLLRYLHTQPIPCREFVPKDFERYLKRSQADRKRWRD